jgi:hypothetical protein
MVGVPPSGADHGGQQQAASGADVAVSTALGKLPGGLLVWSYPALVTVVPGILLLLAIAAQMAGAVAWVPVVRRSLSGVGVARRRRAPPTERLDQL